MIKHDKPKPYFDLRLIKSFTFLAAPEKERVY